MAKIYSKNSPKKVNPQHPKKETIMFLLDYSKALRFNKYQNLQFETFLN